MIENEKDKHQKIDPGMKACWTQALRSGRYKQGAGSLNPYDYDEKGRVIIPYQRTTHCCLGVLANEAGALGKNGVASFEVEGYELPVLSACEVPDFVLDNGTKRRLVTMNDIEKKSFDEIANWIEENL